MKITKALVDSFFNHTCTAAEAKAVADFLIKHPEEAEHYLSDKEWNAAPETSEHPESFWQQQWDAIQERRTRTRKIVVKMTRFAAAAIVILMMGVGVFYLISNRPSQFAEAPAVVQGDEIKTIENNRPEIQLITLADGSRVELMPASTISFQSHFSGDKRDIYLKGEAVFQVAKDSSRPFTVFSGGISTTALGTKFRVVYSKNGGDASVYLYEGRVVIQSYHENKIRKAYLQPGDGLTYDQERGVMDISRSSSEMAGAVAASQTKKQSAKIREDRRSDLKPEDFGQVTPAIVPMWYRFDKEALPNVFDQLADIYNVKITYDAADLQNKYFIGRFEDTRSLRDILETIADINDLKVEKVSTSHYVIKKQ